MLLYLDDAIVYSSSVEQHLQWLEMVLGQLQKEGLKAKPDKWAFSDGRLDIWDIISNQGVYMDTKKIEAVANWRHPA